MRAVVAIAMDRLPEEMLEAFVRPFDAMLRTENLGRVVSHSVRDLLAVDVRLAIRGREGFERVLQFLVENDAPIGTITYRLSWLGAKKDIFVLGP